MNEGVADIVAIAVSYLELRKDSTHDEDDDLRCLEDIATRFQALSSDERYKLARSFDRLGASKIAEGMGLDLGPNPAGALSRPG